MSLVAGVGVTASIAFVIAGTATGQTWCFIAAAPCFALAALAAYRA